ncbi:MAG: hypothetical protein WCO96_04635 [Actinomycetes bacterium]
MHQAESSKVRAAGVQRRSHRTALTLGLAVLTVAAITAALLPGLGHDAWSWMIWAREIAHLELDTTTGSTIKPLPMLLMAPLGPVGELAPFTWLALSRAAWLAVPVFAWQIGDRLGGRRAAAFAAAGALLVPVLFDASVNGYSEPLTALALLGAILALLSNRPTPALALITAAGLMRPEAWAFSLAIGVWGIHSGRVRPATAIALFVAPIAVWAGLSWWGSGEPFGGASGTESIRAAGGVLLPFFNGIAPLAAVGLAAAVVLAVRDRNRSVLMLLGASAAWVVLVAVLIQIGFSGNARYLVPAEVVGSVAAGWGLARACELLERTRLRQAATGAVAVGFGASLLFGLSFAADSISRFRSGSETAAAMKAAVNLAGGRDAIVGVGEPIVMNWSRRTALAWQLEVPITGTQVIWGPNWTGSLELPAILLASPSREGNRRAPLPTNIALESIGRSGEWSVYRAARAGVSTARARSAAR